MATRLAAPAPVASVRNDVDTLNALKKEGDELVRAIEVQRQSISRLETQLANLERRREAALLQRGDRDATLVSVPACSKLVFSASVFLFFVSIFLQFWR
jgi:hypothetical protein